jgi:hypothetical protein
MVLDLLLGKVGNGKRENTETHGDTNTQTPAADEASRKKGNTPGRQRGGRGGETGAQERSGAAKRGAMYSFAGDQTRSTGTAP